jgi:hypothetical protein
MVGFVDPHKVVVRKNAFSTFPSARHEGENRMIQPWKKKKEKKVNLILSHVSNPFFILDP